MDTKRRIVLDFIGKNKMLVSAVLFVLMLSNFLNVLLPVSIGWFYEIVLHEHGPYVPRSLQYLGLLFPSLRGW